MRKSQISLFVIIGLVIVIITAFIVVKLNIDKINKIPTNTTNGEDYYYDERIKPVSDYVESCIKNTSESALVIMGEQGLIYPEVYLASKKTKISYFLFKGENYLPKKITVFEEQISDYIYENIKLCTGNFSNTGFYVDDAYKKIKVNSVFEEKRLNVEINYPLKIYVEGKEILAEKFSSYVDIKFNEMYLLTEKIIEKTNTDPNWVNLAFLESEPYEITIIKIDKYIWIYEIIDYNYGLEKKPFKYRFAVKYEE